METSTLVINDNTYSVKDAKLQNDCAAQKIKFDKQVGEARDLNVEVTEGKEAVATAITSRDVATAPDATFKTMADNVLAIESSGSTGSPGGYTPPTYSFTKNNARPGNKFIYAYPYRYFTEPRAVNSDYNELMIMDVGYTVKDVDLDVSVVARVKRLNDDWAGVPVYTAGGNHYLQFISNTQLAYRNRRSFDRTGNEKTVTDIVTIPDVGSYEELVVEFKYNQDLASGNNSRNASINIAPVVNDEIGTFTEVNSQIDMRGYVWAFTHTMSNPRALSFLGTKHYETEIAPSAVNCKDLAFIVDGRIWVGNTSLYPFPEGFTKE